MGFPKLKNNHDNLIKDIILLHHGKCWSHFIVWLIWTESQAILAAAPIWPSFFLFCIFMRPLLCESAILNSSLNLNLFFFVPRLRWESFTITHDVLAINWQRLQWYYKARRSVIHAWVQKQSFFKKGQMNYRSNHFLAKCLYFNRAVFFHNRDETVVNKMNRFSF